MEATTTTITTDTPPPTPVKVISIAAGEAHTLALTGNGRVYSWGRGMFGRLGTGSDKDELSPAEVSFGISHETSRKIRFVGVSAGAYHSLALADDGSVWSWGYNMYGQLGSDGENSSTPCLLKEFVTDELAFKSELPHKILYVKAGGMMSTAIDNLGTLWIWGNYPHQSGGAEGGFTPSPVRDLFGRTVAKVACGNEHVVVLVSAAGRDDDLVVCSWGTNKHGQLGLGHTESRARPEIVDEFGINSPWEVYEVACGGFHTALLAREKGEGDSVGGSSCWTFGLGENGQLGHGTSLSLVSPQRVEKLSGAAKLVSIDCGLFHTSVASSLGEVWSWGMERGLGLCPDARVGAESGDAFYPLEILPSGKENAKFENPIQVGCGAAHTVLVACDGSKLWSWGRGKSGVLGTGKVHDCLAPTPVSWPEIAEEEAEIVTSREENNTNSNDVVKTKDYSEEGSECKARNDDVEALQRRLATMERYASVLHRSIFRKPFTEQDIPDCFTSSGDFEVAKEWEKMLENAGEAELVGLEMFYRGMESSVKDQIMKRRIKEAVKEYLGSMSS